MVSASPSSGNLETFDGLVLEPSGPWDPLGSPGIPCGPVPGVLSLVNASSYLPSLLPSSSEQDMPLGVDIAAAKPETMLMQLMYSNFQRRQMFAHFPQLPKLYLCHI
jgi:hypothetical protein